jgi:polysaccharide export outer membrane protein
MEPRRFFSLVKTMNTPRTFLTRLLAVAGLSVLMLASNRFAAAAAAPSQKKTIPYTIRNSDKLGVRVFQEDELTITPRVDSKGTLNLTLIGELRVAGMTINQAERAIENAYREGRFLRNPQVTITVEDYAPREVTIGGQVKIPSRYALPLETPMTLLELVGKAGGFTDTAKGTAVRVTRVKADGTLETKTYDVESILRGKKDARAEDSSLTLEPDDIIYVPERII